MTAAPEPRPIVVHADVLDDLQNYARLRDQYPGDEKEQLRRREERRSVACAAIARLLRDNPELERAE